MRTGFRWENTKERDHLKGLGIDEMILKLVLVKQYGDVGWFILFRTGTSGGLL
jgi:hypothetical protein